MRERVEAAYRRSARLVNVEILAILCQRHRTRLAAHVHRRTKRSRRRIYRHDSIARDLCRCAVDGGVKKTSIRIVQKMVRGKVHDLIHREGQSVARTAARRWVDD